MKGKWKESSKKKKGNAVLQKYMLAVGEFVKKSGTEEEEEEAEDHRGLGFVKKKSRKELRKEKRKLKKMKMKSHYEGKKMIGLPADEGEHSGIPADKQLQKMEKVKKVKKEVSHSNKPTGAPAVKSDSSKTPASSKVAKKKMNKLQESRKMALLEANEQEDREIKKLERCLRLNKRKNKKSLPQSFVADGLDYILGVLDSGSSAVGMYDSDDDMDVAKENFEKLDKKLSDEDEEPGDEMASGGSDDDDDMGSFDDENEDAEEDDEDDEVINDDDDDDDEEIINDEEADDEEMEDESDAADSDDEDGGGAEEEADTPDTKTSGSNSGTVSLQPKYLFHYCQH